MSTYLMKFRYSKETWDQWMRDPQDRRPIIQDFIGKLGGELRGYWLALGEYDGYMLIEAPDDTVVAALSMIDIGSGILRAMETTKLIEVEDALKALSKAGNALGYADAD